MSETATKTQSDLIVKRDNGSQTGPEAAQVIGITAEDVQVEIEARVRATLGRMLTSPPSVEIAEPLNWWDGFAFGPFQIGANTVPPSGFAGPLLPHQVIRKGEEAFVATVLILNPAGPAVPSALDVLSNFALPYEVSYGTGELKRWQPGPASLQHVSTDYLVPGQAIYVDVFKFIADEPGLYEMNICFRIFGCKRNPAPPFSGFATWVYDPDEDFLADLLGLPGGPGFYHKNPIRFQVYE